MIGFEIEGEFLDLPEDRQIELNRNSPFFQQDGFIVEDYTLPVTFPNTPKNMRMLGWPHIVENADRLRPRWQCTLFYNGVPRLRGEMRAQRPINSRSISLNFVSGISAIGEDIKDRSIREIVDEEIAIHALTITKTITLDIVPALSERYALRINGTDYEGVDTNALVQAINNDIDATVLASHISNQITITNGTTGEFEPMKVEAPEDVYYVLLSGTPAWMTPYRQAYIDWVETYQGLLRGPESLRIGTFANFDKFFEEEAPLKDFPIVNFSDDDGFLTNRLQADNLNRPQIYNGNSLAPMVTLRYVLTQIATYYDITITAPMIDEDDVFFHNWTLDRPIEYFGQKKLILFERSFNMRQLVPELKVNDLIKALQVGFNARVDYDSRTRTLSFVNRQNAIRERSYIDITDDCTPPAHVSLSVKKGLRFKLREDTGNTLDTDIDRPEDFIVDEGEREISVGFGTPPMRTHTGKGYWPSATFLANYTAAIRQGPSENFTFRLARYTEAFGINFIDSRPFFWSGVDGLIATHWQDAIILENDPVYIENQWLMTREQAFNLDWGQKWRIDRSDFLIQKFNVTLMANGMAMSDCTFIRVPTFVQAAPPAPVTLNWYGVESSRICEKDANGLNTGNAYFEYLYEQDDTETPGTPTGRVKPNAVGDPDFISPAENLTFCPVDAGGAGYQIGSLYITMTPIMENNPSTIKLNGVTYNQPNSFVIAKRPPYPYVMPAGGTALTFIAQNNTTGRWGQPEQVYKYTAKSYIGNTLTKTLSVTVYPGNIVKTDFGDSNSEIFRSLFFNTAEGSFDPANYNRLIIELEII